MFVIGVAGQAQMGKDTLADRLRDKLNEAGGNWTRAAFAANVKKVYCETFGVDLDFVEKWKTVPESPPGFDMTVRQSLQFIGDGFRKILATIWLDLAFRDKSTPKIISDVRYINEFTRVKTEGGLNVLVARPDKLNDDPNGSEAQIRPFIEWALLAFKDRKFVSGSEIKKSIEASRLYNSYIRQAPENMEMFDAYLLNDGSKDEFIELIDSKLVPFVQDYVFEFPEAESKEEEKQCLISS